MMKGDWRTEIEGKLKDIPAGGLLVEKHHLHQDEAVLKTEHFNSCSDGKGKTEIFPVFPGIEICLNRFSANRFTFHHSPLKSVMQINHCRQGRLGWEMKDGLSIYLDPGDLSLHMLDSCAESEMILPAGFYEGIAISVDTEKLADYPLEILQAILQASARGHVVNMAVASNTPFQFLL